MRQNLGWAIGYNTLALPIGAGVFATWLGLTLSPELAALTMAGSSVIVAVNALMLKRLNLPEAPVEKIAPDSNDASPPGVVPAYPATRGLNPTCHPRAPDVGVRSQQLPRRLGPDTQELLLTVNAGCHGCIRGLFLLRLVPTRKGRLT